MLELERINWENWEQEKEKQYDKMKICVSPAGYKYKCKCGGEFNEPARDSMGINSNGNPRCPWCGEPMRGL